MFCVKKKKKWFEKFIFGIKSNIFFTLFISQFEPEIAGYVPIATSYVPPGYWHQRAHIPSYNERMKTWLTPRKRNSELINSLLGLPKNIDVAGK